jgi:hypothetical protein
MKRESERSICDFCFFTTHQRSASLSLSQAFLFYLWSFLFFVRQIFSTSAVFFFNLKGREADSLIWKDSDVI